MNIKSISISGLRGFSKDTKIKLGIPNNKRGSGITMLLGSNNSGKSTIVEAFEAISKNHPSSFTEGKRNKNYQSRIKIGVILNNKKIKELTTVPSGGSETEWNDPDIQSPSIFVLPSRRLFSPFFGKSTVERKNYITDYAISNFRSGQIDRFSGRLFKAQNDRSNFNKVISKIINPVPSWEIEQSDSGQYYLKFKFGKHSHSSDGLGDGLISILFIADALYDSSPGDMIVIDEPELSLHPSLQRKLFDLFMDYSKDRQIVISTHSPFFIDWDIALNKGKIYRVFKKNNSVRVATLSNKTLTKVQGLLMNLNNPHIFGLDANEVFFLDDNVLLLEGQEDVICYKKICQQLGIALIGNLYGWGVGGADNMPLIAQILSELKFEKIAGVLDKNKSNVKKCLEIKFPSYKFFTIPENDVRTKPAQKKKGATVGLFKKNLELRSKHKKEVKKIFENINNYMK